MTALVEFLRARLDERERAANAATRGPWWAVGTLFPAEGSHAEEMLRGYVDCNSGSVTEETIKGADAWHISLNDPEAALADVEARRRIVEWTLDGSKGGPDAYPPDDVVDVVREHALLPVLQLLALPYAAHPDYDPSWRPAEVTA